MLSFLDFKIPEDNWDESNSSDMDSYGSDCDDIMSGNKIVINSVSLEYIFCIVIFCTYIQLYYLIILWVDLIAIVIIKYK